MTVEDPRTLEDWRKAALAAAGFQLIAAAKDYGLVAGGPPINLDRCDELLAGAAEHGIVITPEEAHRAAVQLILEVNEGLRWSRTGDDRDTALHGLPASLPAVPERPPGDSNGTAS